MTIELNALATDREFFAALIGGKLEVLDQLLVDDFILVDVMRGDEISKPALLAAVASGQVKFESIEPADAKVRNFGSTAIVNGRTEMRGRAGDTAFAARSRYTHVYVEQRGRLRLASAQGTQIAEE
jgi:ketosteroid isomerase-like protein